MDLTPHYFLKRSQKCAFASLEEREIHLLGFEDAYLRPFSGNKIVADYIHGVVSPNGGAAHGPDPTLAFF
jgi:hypothetical protein